MNQKEEQIIITGVIFFGLGIIMGQFFLLFFATNHNLFYVYLSLFLAEVFFFVLVCRVLYKKTHQYKYTKSVVKQFNKAVQKIKKHEKNKNDFVSIASHQLRTPLSILAGYIELLHDGVYGKISPNMEEVFLNMAQTNDRLLRVVEHFLCVSEVERASLSYRFEQQNISLIVDTVIEELSQHIKEHQVKIKVIIPKDILAFVDKQKVQHVFYNIIDNAIKYSSKKMVMISLKQDKKQVTFTCRDTGIGFSKKDAKHISKKFYRANNATGQQMTGTGLGLFVCKTFILGHKGFFTITSSGIDKGTLVIVTLPINQLGIFAKG